MVWEKIPDFQVKSDENNIWTESQEIKVDFEKIEALFTVQEKTKKKSPRDSALSARNNQTDSSKTEDLKGKVSYRRKYTLKKDSQKVRCTKKLFQFHGNILKFRKVFKISS